MANTKISNLTALGAAPATDDLLVAVDTSAGETKKLTVANLIAAITGVSQTFTASQAFGSGASGAQVAVKGAAAGTVPLLVDTASSPSASVAIFRNDGTSRLYVMYNGSLAEILRAEEFDNGSGTGNVLYVKRNNNASTPAPGTMLLQRSSTALSYLWPDDSGNWRTGTTAPNNANINSGTVVGTQTSWHELKENIEEWNGAEALDAIRALTLYSYQMIEDSQETRGGEKPTYKGLVIQDADRESDAWFALGMGDQQVPVLNDRNLFGYMLAAIRHGGDIIVALQDRVAALEAQVGQ